MARKKDDAWWESERNDFDNDIEQFSRAAGGGGCLLTVVAVLSTAALTTLFLGLLSGLQ